VLGAGLIGGAIALRLHAAGRTVTVWDPAADSRDEIHRAGLATADDIHQAVNGAELVFLAGPLAALPGLVAEVLPLVNHDCVVTDVGSSKAGVLAAARRCERSGRFVGGHPMAGAPHTGFRAATAELLVGAPWALCVDDLVDLSAFRALAGVLTEQFQARVVPVTAAGHDDAAALVSHLPHLMAAALTTVTAASGGLAPLLAAASYGHSTAPAASAPYRSTAMVWENRDAVRRALAALTQALADADAALGRGDMGQVRALFDAAYAVKSTGPMTSQGWRRFRADEAVAERRFLAGWGAAGGWLRSCQVDAGVVSYECSQGAAAGAQQ